MISTGWAKKLHIFITAHRCSHWRWNGFH